METTREDLTTSSEPTYRFVPMVRIWSFLLVAAAICLLYFTSLGRTPLLTNSEIRCHDIARNMYESGDYLVPRYDQQLRTQKPPLFYWLACASAKLAGNFTLFTLRLPAALAAFCVLGIVSQWCRDLKLSWLQAVLAIGGLATTYLFVLHARRGSFEMPLTLFCALSFYACYRLMSGFRWSWAVIAAISFGLGFLTKATPVFLFVPLPFLGWLLLQRRLGRVVRDWRFYVLFVLAMLIGISWYAAVMAHEPQARRIVFAEAVLPLGVEDEEVKTATHFASWWFFLAGIWRSAFPICLFLPLIAVQAWKERGYVAASEWRLLLFGILAPLIVFSVIPQKQDHYLLPVFPYIALLGVHSVRWAVSAGNSAAAVLVRAAASLLAVVVFCLSLFIAVGTRLVADAPLVVAVALGLVAAALGLYSGSALWRHKTAHAALASLTGVFLGMFCYFGLIRPVEDAFHSGEIYALPGYNAMEWDLKFERYPLLRLVLKADKGLKKQEEAQKAKKERHAKQQQ
jgi:hypothetical protein